MSSSIRSLATHRALSATGVALILVTTLSGSVFAQNIRLPADLADSARLVQAMPGLATTLLEQHPDLDDRFRMEIVAGRYEDAVRSLAALRTVRTRAAAGEPA